MQKIPAIPPKQVPGKKTWQDWAWKLNSRDKRKTIALIEKNVKKQIDGVLNDPKKNTKKRKVSYEWQVRVKIYITPPATRASAASGTGDPSDPKQPPPPSI